MLKEVQKKGKRMMRKALLWFSVPIVICCAVFALFVFADKSAAVATESHGTAGYMISEETLPALVAAIPAPDVTPAVPAIVPQFSTVAIAKLEVSAAAQYDARNASKIPFRYHLS